MNILRVTEMHDAAFGQWIQWQEDDEQSIDDFSATVVSLPCYRRSWGIEINIYKIFLWEYPMLQRGHVYVKHFIPLKM